MDLMGGQDDPVDVGVDLDSYLNADVEWVGLPKFVPLEGKRLSIVIAFDSEEDRDRLVDQLGLFIAKKTGVTWSAWWPPREQEDLASLRFDFGGDE
jgi:hypothetical protein